MVMTVGVICDSRIAARVRGNYCLETMGFTKRQEVGLEVAE